MVSKNKTVHPILKNLEVIAPSGKSFIAKSVVGGEGKKLMLDVAPENHPAWTGTMVLSNSKKSQSFRNKFNLDLK